VTYKLLHQTNWTAMQLSVKLFLECRRRWPVTCITYVPGTSYQKSTGLIPTRSCWVWGCLLTPAWEIKRHYWRWNNSNIISLLRIQSYGSVMIQYIFQPNMLLLTNKSLQGILVQGKTPIDRWGKNRSGNAHPVPEVVLINKHISTFPAGEPLLRKRL
jgi:hypothetical protein